MTTKKAISFLTSLVLLSGAFCALPEHPDGTALFPASIVAEAGSGSDSVQTITSGITSNISYQCNANVTLYFTQNASDHHLEVCGSRISAENASVEIPQTVPVGGVNYPVTAIAHHAFQGQTNLNSVYTNTLPIGGAAFYDCTNLEYVYGTTPTIGDSAFHGCTSLHSCYFALNASSIGSHAFWGCTGFIAVQLDNVSSLGFAAFYDCTGVKTIDLSKSSLTAIPEFAFHNNSNATKVLLPETLTCFENQAFSCCRSLQRIYIPDNVMTIGTAAFMRCDALEIVMMSENIASIADHAFFDCPSMEFIVCKNKNAYIGDWAFGWHLENNHLLKNNDFTVWSTGSGNVQNFANSQGFTFRSIAGAAKAAATRYCQYEWAQTNQGMFWGNKSHNYYIAPEHKAYSDKNNQYFEGICSGMAAVSVLTANGYLPISDYMPGYTCLNKVKSIPMPTRSYVTTVFSNFQAYPVLDYDYRTEYSDTYSNGVFSKEMMRYAEYMNYGADAAVMLVHDYLNSGIPHATVCFGMEQRAEAADRNNSYWNGWDARLMIYNVNKTTHSEKDYVYVNFSDGSWTSSLDTDNQGNKANCNLTMIFTPEKMVKRTDMTAAEFFNQIKLS